MIGKVFGRLTVLQEMEPRKYKSGAKARMYLVSCECGNRKVVQYSSLVSGLTRSCGCLHKEQAVCNLEKTRGVPASNRLDLTGKQFGKLTITGIAYIEKQSTYWNALCDCGNTKIAKGALLKMGSIKSCGCRKLEASFENGKANAGKKNVVKRRKARTAHIGKIYGKLKINKIHWVAPNTPALAYCTCECGTETSSNLNDILQGKTQSCGCGVHWSKPCEELFQIALRYCPDAIKEYSFGSRYRYDIAIPSKKIVIEFNGAIWHSMKYRSDTGFHRDKRLYAESHGYRMISIWSDQWEAQRERMVLLIERACVGGQTKLYARKLSAGLVDFFKANAFHKRHHIQVGRVSASQNIALFEGGEIVAVASFKGNELLRYSVKDGVGIVGGLAKCIAASGLDVVVTYCDRDHFTGGLYAACGFRHVGTTLQLSYLFKGERCRREKFMKHKLSALGIEVLPDDTEKTALERAGIYGCFNSGIDKWIWRKSER